MDLDVGEAAGAGAALHGAPGAAAGPAGLRAEVEAVRERNEEFAEGLGKLEAE